jgi:hypothetical protein
MIKPLPRIGRAEYKARFEGHRVNRFPLRTSPITSAVHPGPTPSPLAGPVIYRLRAVQSPE